MTWAWVATSIGVDGRRMKPSRDFQIQFDSATSDSNIHSERGIPIVQGFKISIEELSCTWWQIVLSA